MDAQPLTRTYKSGTYLFRENDFSRELYLIQSGSVRIFRRAGGKETDLAMLGPGAVVGEMALIDGKPRSASALATEQTTAVAISAECFHARIRDVPPWFLTIIKIISEKIRVSNKRLQNLVGDRAVLSIVLGMSYLLPRTATEVCTLEQTIARLTRLLSLTHYHVSSTLNFLGFHGLIRIENGRVYCPDEDRFIRYCLFLRQHARKAFQNIPPAPARVRDYLTAVMKICPELATTENKQLELERLRIERCLDKPLTAQDMESVCTYIERNQLATFNPRVGNRQYAAMPPETTLIIQCARWRLFALHAGFAHLIPTL